MESLIEEYAGIIIAVITIYSMILIFMMILMASFGGARNGVIPITTIFVAVFYLGGELWNAIFQQNNIAELAHIVGGLCGMLMGFALSGKRKR